MSQHLREFTTKDEFEGKLREAVSEPLKDWMRAKWFLDAAVSDLKIADESANFALQTLQDALDAVHQRTALAEDAFRVFAAAYEKAK